MSGKPKRCAIKMGRAASKARGAPGGAVPDTFLTLVVGVFDDPSHSSLVNQIFERWKKRPFLDTIDDYLPRDSRTDTIADNWLVFQMDRATNYDDDDGLRMACEQYTSLKAKLQGMPMSLLLRQLSCVNLLTFQGDPTNTVPKLKSLVDDDIMDYIMDSLKVDPPHPFIEYQVYMLRVLLQVDFYSGSFSAVTKVELMFAIEKDYAASISRTEGLTKMEILNFAVFSKQADPSMLCSLISEVASAYSEKPRAHSWEKTDHDNPEIDVNDVFGTCCNGIDEYLRLRPDRYVVFDHVTRKINRPFESIFMLLLSINKITVEEYNSGTRLVNIIPFVHGTKGTWFWDLMYLMDHLYHMFTRPKTTLPWEEFQEQPEFSRKSTMSGICASGLPTSRTCCICCGRLASTSVMDPRIVVDETNGKCWENIKFRTQGKKSEEDIKLLSSQDIPGKTCLKDECWASELMDVKKQSRFDSRNIKMIEQTRGVFEDHTIRKTPLMLTNVSSEHYPLKKKKPSTSENTPASEVLRLRMMEEILIIERKLRESINVDTIEFNYNYCLMCLTSNKKPQKNRLLMMTTQRHLYYGDGELDQGLIDLKLTYAPPIQASLQIDKIRGAFKVLGLDPPKGQFMWEDGIDKKVRDAFTMHSRKYATDRPNNSTADGAKHSDVNEANATLKQHLNISDREDVKYRKRILEYFDPCVFYAGKRTSVDYDDIHTETGLVYQGVYVNCIIDRTKSSRLVGKVLGTPNGSEYPISVFTAIAPVSKHYEREPANLLVFMENSSLRKHKTSGDPIKVYHVIIKKRLKESFNGYFYYTRKEHPDETISENDQPRPWLQQMNAFWVRKNSECIFMDAEQVLKSESIYYRLRKEADKMDVAPRSDGVSTITFLSADSSVIYKLDIANFCINRPNGTYPMEDRKKVLNHIASFEEGRNLLISKRYPYYCACCWDDLELNYCNYCWDP